MLRSVAIKTVRHLGVVGECNIQYALNPDSKEVSCTHTFTLSLSLSWLHLPHSPPLPFPSISLAHFLFSNNPFPFSFLPPVLHHRGECPSLSQLSTGLQGHRLSTCIRGGKTCSRKATPILEELCYPGNHSLLRAQSRLCGGEDTAMGPVQVQQGERGTLLCITYGYSCLQRTPGLAVNCFTACAC